MEQKKKQEILISKLINQVFVTKDLDAELKDLKADAEEAKQPFSCTYELGRAIDANKTKLEELWAALGATCNYEIAAIVKPFMTELELRKEANNE